MKSKRLIVIIAIALALVAVGLWVWQRREVPSTAAGTIRVAANLPMSGPLATYGVAVREGASMALDEAPLSETAAKIVVDWQDNAGDPTTAVSILRKQLLETPTLYVSGVKPQTMAIKDEVSQQNLPHFVWIFDAYINQQTTNNFRTWVSYKIEPPIYIDYVKRRQAKRIAVTYVQLPHTVEEFEKILVPKLREGGAELFVEPYDFGRTDFKDIAAKIASFKPDLIVLNGFQGDLVGLIRSLRPLDTITDGNTIATYDLLDAAKILGPDEIEGIRIVAPVFETRPESAAIAEWRKRFRERYGSEPLYTHAFAYDMIGAIRVASRSLQSSASSEDWINALRSVDTQGITGPIRFDSDGDMVTPLEVGVYRNGKLVPEAAQSN